MNALSRLTRLFMMALLLPSRSSQPAPRSDDDGLRPSRHRNRADVQGHVPAADPGGGPRSGSVQVVLLNDPEINAFVATGQTVYIQSGLFAADNVNQLQGVVAHELGHVAGGHAIRCGEGAEQATGISIATLILGARRLPPARGEAGMGVMAAGQQAALGEFLAFTRAQEATADAAAARYLSRAGISGKGMLDFFGKLQNQEYRLAIYATDSYDAPTRCRCERIQALERSSSPIPPGTSRPIPRSKRASSG